MSAKPDTLDWKKRRDTAYTPQKDYGDLTALNKLPPVNLALQESVKHQGNNGSVQVTVRNPGKDLAFMVHLRLTRGKGGEDVVPIFWDDNYISLLPGESRQLTATYEVSALGGTTPVVEVDGWNIGSIRRQAR